MAIHPFGIKDSKVVELLSNADLNADKDIHRGLLSDGMKECSEQFFDTHFNKGYEGGSICRFPDK